MSLVPTTGCQWYSLLVMTTKNAFRHQLVSLKVEITILTLYPTPPALT